MSIKHNHALNWCCFYYFLRNSLVALLEALFAQIDMSVNIAFQQTSSLTNNIIFVLNHSRNSQAEGGTAPDPPPPDGVWPKRWREQWSRPAACLLTCGSYAVPRPAPCSRLVWSPGATTVPLDPAHVYLARDRGRCCKLDTVSATPSWAQTMSSLARPDYCALTCALLVPPGGGLTWQNQVSLSTRGIAALPRFWMLHSLLCEPLTHSLSWLKHPESMAPPRHPRCAHCLQHLHLSRN